jgi:Tfp pilus assembly protein FimV
LTHALRPIFAATVLAFGLAAATGSQAANLVNWEGLKSSFTYTPMAGESLDRIIAKTMPNSDLKTEVLAEAFKALNPLHFSKDANTVAKTNTALKVPNQNQVFNMVEAQLGDKFANIAKASVLTLADAKPAESKPQAKGMLAGTKTATPKINPKTESWVRFPASMMALSKKVEGWVRFPSAIAPSPVSAEWVRYPSNANQDLDILGASKTTSAKQFDQREWVRYQIAKADALTD